MDIINKHTHFAPGGYRSPSNPSYNSDSKYSDQTSMVSRSSGVLGTLTRSESPAIMSSATEPPTSPARSNTGRIVSGVSGISDREASHLRQISEATVSSQESGAILEEPATSAQSPVTPGETGPVSPPTGEERTGSDYISARHPSSGSPLRRSMFRENEDDLGDRRL
jgi:hypothetical protein